MSIKINNVFKFLNPNNILKKREKIEKNKLIIPTNTNLQKVLGENNIDVVKKIGKAGDQLNQEVYIFGGAVRDCLLNKNPNDLDLIVNGDALEFSNYLYTSNRDTFYKLHTKPSVKRATLYTKNVDIDIKSLSKNNQTIEGKDNVRKALIQSIMNNDYTMNRMLIKLDHGFFGEFKLKFMDLLNSKQDLKKNTLRHSTKEFFLHDPIQKLRGKRFQLAYKMKIAPETHDLMKQVKETSTNRKNWYFYRYIREYYRILKNAF